MNSIEYEKLKCIWMTSHVIDYKICNNNFDCENCSFDKAMKNLITNTENKSNINQNIISEISKKIKSIKFDDKIVYLRNSLIAKNICEDIYYFGLNPIFECFLSTNFHIEVDETSDQINRGQSILSISGAWGSVSVSSPIDLVIYDRIQGLENNKLSPRWIAIIGDKSQEIKKNITIKTEWDNLYKKAARLIDEIKNKEPIIGETMMDGGKFIGNLPQLIGNKKYIEILKLLSSS